MSPIPLFKVFMAPGVDRRVADVLYSGQLAEGPLVQQFERELGARLDTPHVATVNSGTAALQLALRLIGLRPGDEVISTPLTCVATNWPVLAQGGRLVWADTDPKTCNIDIADVARKITSRTAAVIVVHWGGYPVDLVALREAIGPDLPIIEDCAHAFGARYRGQAIGGSGNYCAFSFQAIKLLTTGDGGCLTVPDAETQQQARMLRWFGLDRQRNDGRPAHSQNIAQWGEKLHMNEIAATIGLGQLPTVSANLQHHQALSKYYDVRLADVGGITTLSRQLGFDSACWLYTLLAEDRENLIRKLASHGISADVVHLRNDRHDCTLAFRTPLPQLDSIDHRRLCIPCGWWVTDEQRQFIVNTIKTGW